MLRSTTWVGLGLGLVATVALGLRAPADAVVGSISRSVVSGGGTRVAAGNVILDGTIGEAVVGPADGGLVRINSGYWWAAIGPLVDVPSVEPVPSILRIHPAAPNPFGRSTQLVCELPRPEAMRVTVYDLRGARVRVLADGRYPAGTHRLSWDGNDGAGRQLPSAVYLMEVRAGDRSWRRKLVKVQ